MLYKWGFQRGHLSIDECAQISQTVTTGSPASAALFLLPQWHSSAPKTAVVKHRRLLEDKVLGNLD